MFAPSRFKLIHPSIHWSILSGMAALIYQVVLQKICSYVLGGALLSTTIVVAAYMLGLALGGLLAGLFCDRLTPRSNRSLYLHRGRHRGLWSLQSHRLSFLFSYTQQSSYQRNHD